MDDQTISQTNPLPAESGGPAVKKSQATLESVQADTVQLNQSSANQINADSVNIHDSGVQQIQGTTVTVNDCGVGVVHATTVDIRDSGIGICSASEATINSNVGVMIGQSVTLSNHRTGLVLTREVHGGPIHSIFFLAGHSEAPVETIVDQRSVALFGLATGIAMGLVIGIFRLLKH
jgi:hypothetical protein